MYSLAFKAFRVQSKVMFRDDIASRIIFNVAKRVARLCFKFVDTDWREDD